MPAAFVRSIHATLLTTAMLAVGCSSSGDAAKDGKDAKPAKPAPAQPANGAPVAFEVTKMTPGEKFEGKLALEAYNFSDKKIGAYGLVARFTDADGKPLKVGVGTPFEDEVAWTSMSGNKFACEPKSWCTLEMSGIEVPAKAAKAEVTISSVKAIAADGVKFEEPDLWKSPEGTGKWPKDFK